MLMYHRIIVCLSNSAFMPQPQKCANTKMSVESQIRASDKSEQFCAYSCNKDKRKSLKERDALYLFLQMRTIEIVRVEPAQH